MGFHVTSWNVDEALEPDLPIMGELGTQSIGADQWVRQPPGRVHGVVQESGNTSGPASGRRLSRKLQAYSCHNLSRRTLPSFQAMTCT